MVPCSSRQPTCAVLKMRYVSLILGQAGTGKTTKLINDAAEAVRFLLDAKHKSALAITRMHGSRRRLQQKLAEKCPNVPFLVTTIDGFALSIVNRWRTALGYSRPIVPGRAADDVVETLFGVEVSFNKVLADATKLLATETVGSIIGAAFPLIVIDEFQDCRDDLLGFVVALSKHTNLLLAADDFQFLDAERAICPAVDWFESASGQGHAKTELTTIHRTSNQGILGAARAVRENTPATDATIPLYCWSGEGQAAWRVVQKLVYERWLGSAALICPSHDACISKILDSCNNQLAKKGLPPIRWIADRSLEAEQAAMRPIIESIAKQQTYNATRKSGQGADPLRSQIARRAFRFARLKGLGSPSTEVIERAVQDLLRERHAYSPRQAQRIVTTVHGAKNLEFDNVFVLWTYRVHGDAECQRRLLYNAITRAKKNCIVLFRGTIEAARKHPVVSLLGHPQDALPRSGTANRRGASRR
jgi:UvrD-like helicase C-terminal domain